MCAVAIAVALRALHGLCARVLRSLTCGRSDSRHPTTTPGILSTEPESNFDYEEILTEVPNDKKYRHRVSPEKSKHPDVKDPALEDANLNRKSPEDDVTIEELPAFSNSPSQVVSEFSDSGHEELIFSTDNTPLDPQAPSRDQCTKTFLQ